MEWVELTSKTYNIARRNLSSIQLRMNPQHLIKKPKGHEAKLMKEIQATRQDFLKNNFGEVVKGCDRIREAAAPLLKVEWERVKKGELLYRIIRGLALIFLISGITALLASAYWLVFINGIAQNAG